MAVTSGISRRPRAYAGAYGATKAALDALIKSYSEEVANTAIKANLVNPGPMRTDMRAAFMPGEDPMTLPAPEEIAPLFLKLADAALTISGEWISFPEWRETGVLENPVRCRLPF